LISWRRELRDARRKGRRDGRAGVPGANDVALPFDLREILARGQEQSERVLARWRDQDQRLEAELDDLTQRAAEAETRLAEAERQRDAAQADHERRTEEDDERLGRLQTQLEELPASEIPAIEPDELERQAPLTLVAPITGGAQSEAEPVHTERAFERHGSPTSTEASWHGIRPVLYWPLIALIVIGEIPLNAFAFRLFHEPDVLTYAMTVTVAVGLVLLAHGLGLFLSRPERNRVERILVGVFVALPTAAIAVISLVRNDYLVDVGGDIGIGPVLGTVAFGLINLLVFGAAAGLSFLRHDPRTVVNRRASARADERERTRAERRQEERQRRRQDRERRSSDEQNRRQLELRTQRRQADLEARRRESGLRREQTAGAMWVIREASRERLQRLSELRAHVDAAHVAHGEAQRAAQAAAAERSALRESTDAELRSIRAHRDRLFFAYCSANVRARTGHVTPACFETVPPLELPAGFADPVARAA
jgi:hypothetical protein